MNDPSPPELMRLLRVLIASGALRLDLDFRHLDHMDCPIAVEADSNVWIYGGVALCALAFWLGGAWIGVAAIAVCLTLYLSLGRRYVHHRLRQRVHEVALNDSEIWRRLWRFGGVALVGDNEIRCVAPEGNWMAVVRARSGI